MGIPLNFTISDIEKEVEERKVTSTVRSLGFIRRFNIRVGSIVEIKLHRRRIGFALVTDVKPLSEKESSNLEFLKSKGFKTDTFIPNNLYLIEFKWMDS